MDGVTDLKGLIKKIHRVKLNGKDIAWSPDWSQQTSHEGQIVVILEAAISEEDFL